MCGKADGSCRKPITLGEKHFKIYHSSLFKYCKIRNESKELNQKKHWNLECFILKTIFSTIIEITKSPKYRGQDHTLSKEKDEED